MLIGGAGAAKIKTSIGISKLPGKLLKLQVELHGMRTHMMTNCPAEWKTVLASTKHPALTLASWHFQIGERVDLDKVSATLPPAIIVHGWLGDSVLTTCGFDPEAFCAEMETQGFYITCRKFPANAAEYFASFLKKTGGEFDQRALSDRQLRRKQAFEYAAKWLASGDEEDLQKRKGPMPHLEFAIAIEDHLPTRRNPRTNKEELYVPEDGVWMASGGGIRGELISDALLRVFAPRRWEYVKVDGLCKARLVPGDEQLFHFGPTLNGIADMVKNLRFDPATVLLDEGLGIDFLKNFKGKWCIDFATPKPEVDWNDDEQLLMALHSCVRPSRMSDRTTRSVPKEFEDYTSPHKLQMARALRKAILELEAVPVTEEVGELSTETKAALTEAMTDDPTKKTYHHPMTQHVFYEAHLDWDSAVQQLRLIFDPLNCPGKLCQSASFVDDGSGSTGKGTIRELVDSCLGVHNGKDQTGYVCTLNVEALATKKSEAPSEQKANLFLCSHAFIDDFSPNKPLNNVALRQLTGGNNLTAARKHQGEIIFKFKGQLILQANGLWCPDEPFIGSDKRRHAGLTFAIKFVDNPTTLNELEKNTNIKQHIEEYFAEFWFLARVFWLLPKPRPGSDRTTPICPNSESLAKALMNEREGNCHELEKEVVEKFIEERLEVYTTKLAPPAAFTAIEAAFKQWLEPAVVDVEVLRHALRTVLMYKPAVCISKFETRKRTSVNAYTKDNEIMTLKPNGQLVFPGAAPDAASSSGV